MQIKLEQINASAATRFDTVLVSGGYLKYATSATGGVRVPAGTSAQRPPVPLSGTFRYNTTTNVFEYYDGVQWTELGRENFIRSYGGFTEIEASSTGIIAYASGELVLFADASAFEIKTPDFHIETSGGIDRFTVETSSGRVTIWPSTGSAYTFPLSNGSAGSVLKTDGANPAQLYWHEPSYNATAFLTTGFSTILVSSGGYSVIGPLTSVFMDTRYYQQISGNEIQILVSGVYEVTQFHAFRSQSTTPCIFLAYPRTNGTISPPYWHFHYMNSATSILGLAGVTPANGTFVSRYNAGDIISFIGRLFFASPGDQAVSLANSTRITIKRLYDDEF